MASQNSSLLPARQLIYLLIQLKSFWADLATLPPFSQEVFEVYPIRHSVFISRKHNLLYYLVGYLQKAYLQKALSPESISSIPSCLTATWPILFGRFHLFTMPIVLLRLPNNYPSPSQFSIRSLLQTQFAFSHGSTESSSFNGSVTLVTAASAPPFKGPAVLSFTSTFYGKASLYGRTPPSRRFLQRL